MSEQVSPEELVPFGVVTVTATSPALPAGLVAVTSLEDTGFTLVAATFPKSTAVAPERFAPVIVMGVPPEVEPTSGLTPEISGTGGPDGMLPDSTRVCPD